MTGTELTDTMNSAPAGAFDEALERFHATGPEFQGWLSNHGPMAVESLGRHGASARIHGWTDGYLERLDDRPRPISPIDPEGWRDPLGDPVRTGDWIDFFEREVTERPLSEMLDEWWPRLLPGIAAGATHGVIRTGHALRALRAAQTHPRRIEVAHALAYWAARWRPTPVSNAAVSNAAVSQSASPGAGAADSARTDLLAGLLAVPAIQDQRFGIRSRLDQLASTAGFAESVAALESPSDAKADVPAELARLVDAAVAFYAVGAHGQPTMLVHAATAPNAVLSALPSLERWHWLPSLQAARVATAAVIGAYRPPALLALPDPASGPGPSSALAWQRALAHGGDHVVKFADTALDSWHRTGDPVALHAIGRAIDLDA